MNQYQINEADRAAKLESIGQDSEWGFDASAVAALDAGAQLRRDFGGSCINVWRERQIANPVYAACWYEPTGDWTRTESTSTGAIATEMTRWNRYIGATLADGASREQIEQQAMAYDQGGDQ